MYLLLFFFLFMFLEPSLFFWLHLKPVLHADFNHDEPWRYALNGSIFTTKKHFHTHNPSYWYHSRGDHHTKQIAQNSRSCKPHFAPVKKKDDKKRVKNKT